MDSIAGSIDTAVPDTFEAKQNIALQLRPDLLQLISKPDYGRRPHALYRSKWPVVFGPFIRRHKLDLVAGFDDSICKSFQVRLGTTAPRITAANESDFELFCHSKRSRGIPSPIHFEVIPRDSSTLLRVVGNDNFTRSTFARILVGQCWVKP
ncbi:MAG: hypothetical protein DMF08_11165 [Verrucomicrobia bacterium]|nr:MAG: hypothetical protein DMF08_11165 [Verrucomicrobiota bacterium]